MIDESIYYNIFALRNVNSKYLIKNEKTESTCISVVNI